MSETLVLLTYLGLSQSLRIVHTVRMCLLSLGVLILFSFLSARSFPFCPSIRFWEMRGTSLGVLQESSPVPVPVRTREGLQSRSVCMLRSRGKSSKEKF